LLEENEDDFQEQLFFGKRNAKNVRQKLELCSAIKLTEEQEAFLQLLMPYLEKNNKANKEAVARLCAGRNDLFVGIDVVTKKVVNSLLKNSESWQYSTPEQRELWAKYVELADKEADLKKAIKDASAELLKAIPQVYANLTIDKVKPIIINDKWLANINDRISKEMEAVTHAISVDIIALAERYENTLSLLHATYTEKENAVLNHLKSMGFEL
jgi:type I restriction enzyme M protein